MSVIEKNIPLRVFNYLRIRHGYRLHYNLLLPGFFTAIFFSTAYYISDELPSLGKEGLLSDFSQLLAILSPFYLAALAAVSTFGGFGEFDEKIKMANPPMIDHFVKGRWERNRVLSTRQFLSLLFGYCATVSILLFLSTVLASNASAICVTDRWTLAAVLDWSIALSFLFIFFHMVTASILGIYYLSDKIHRDGEN